MYVDVDVIYTTDGACDFAPCYGIPDCRPLYGPWPAWCYAL